MSAMQLPIYAMIHFRNGFHRAIMRRRKPRIRPVDEATSHILSSGDKQGLTQNVIDDYKGMLGTFELLE